MDYLKNLKWEMIIFSLECIAMGVLFTFFSSSAKDIVAIVLSIVLFFYSIRHFIEYFRRRDMENVFRYELVLGVVFLILGIVVLTQMDTIMKLFAYFVGTIILISGLMKLENAIDLKRMDRKWIPMMVIAFVFIILSLIFFIKPIEDGKDQGDTLLVFSGIAFLFVGVVNLITTLSISGSIKEWTREQSQVDTKVVDADYEEVKEKDSLDK